MNYKDIKPYNERCEKFHGIVTNERLMEVLIDEIEELRGFIEAKSKPLTDEEILKAWKPYEGNAFTTKYEFARAIEQAHGIGGKE